MGIFDRATPPPAELFCSFCGKSQREVKKLVAGPKAHICDECVALSVDIIRKEEQVALPKVAPTVAELLAALERGAVALGASKRALAAAMRQHLARVVNGAAQVRVPRVLLVGPRGSGKTALGRALCAASPVPARLVDVGRLSATGFVGENVENVVFDLVDAAKGDLAIAEKGVLFLDGIDRLAAKVPPERGETRDIRGAEVQRDLLRLLDGLPIRGSAVAPRHPNLPGKWISGEAMLIVGAAALPAAKSRRSDRALREALVASGILPEVLARFDVVREIEPPTAEALMELLVTRLVPGLQTVAQGVGATVELTPQAVSLLAHAAAASPDGAWALQPPLSTIAEEILTAREAARPWVVDGEKMRALVGATETLPG